MRGYTIAKDDYLKRLRRIEGQVRGLQRMIDEDTGIVHQQHVGDATPGGECLPCRPPCSPPAPADRTRHVYAHQSGRVAVGVGRDEGHLVARLQQAARLAVHDPRVVAAVGTGGDDDVHCGPSAVNRRLRRRPAKRRRRRWRRPVHSWRRRRRTRRCPRRRSRCRR